MTALDTLDEMLDSAVGISMRIGIIVSAMAIGIIAVTTVRYIFLKVFQLNISDQDTPLSPNFQFNRVDKILGSIIGIICLRSLYRRGLDSGRLVIHNQRLYLN